MDNLKKEYTDVKKNKHKVNHLSLSSEDKNSREQIVEELVKVLTRPGKRIPA